LKLRKEDIKLYEKNMEREITRFINFTGEKIWRSKIEKVVAYKKGHQYSHLTNLICNKNPLAEPLNQFFTLSDQGKSIWKNKTRDLIWLALTAIAINRIIHFSTDKAKRKIESILIDDNLAESFLFEVEVATHYLINGYDVIFNDLEREDDQAVTFDLLIKIDSFEGEVECKRINYDTGRKITRLGFRYIIDTVQPYLLDLEKNLIINIIAKNRLDINQARFRELAKVLKEKINQSDYQFESNGITFKITELPEFMGEISNEEARNMLTNYRKESAHGYVMKHGNNIIFILAESEKNDQVLDKTYKRLKEASKQFSGDKPSFIACYIEDVDESDWELLRQNSAISNMTFSFFDDTRMSHINIVTYSSRGSIKIKNNVIRFSAQNLYFQNDNCKFKDQNKYFLVRAGNYI